MILGIGSDIISVDRIKKVIDRKGDSFLEYIFTKKEIEYCKKFNNSYLRFAGRFCAKESIVKAMGKGISKEISWKDMEIINDNFGKPNVAFSNKVNRSFNFPKIFLSISHTESVAFAVTIWSK